MLTVNTDSAAQTRELGAVLGRLLHPGDVLCLNGDFGAGKTAFAQGVADGLAVTGPVTSPTFIIVNEHEGRLPLYHFDVYRLNGPRDMAAIGFDEYLERGGVVLIEWADRVTAALPEERLDIIIERVDENRRSFTIIPRGSGYVSLVEELSAVVGPGA